jgi:putative ABC transport system permease protein
MRAALSVLGIAIGIAALVAVVGISESSRADLLDQLDSLGTNLLSVAPGQSFAGGDAALPDTAGPMIGRINPVREVSEVANLDTTVRRTDYVDENETGGIQVTAVEPGLLGTVSGTVASGTFITPANGRFQSVVLGSVAAERLGITDVGTRVYLGDRWFTVVGILEELPLAGDLDRSAMVGFEAATRDVGFGERPDTTKIYLRTDSGRVNEVRDVLAATANPGDPSSVDVSRPSDVLEARAAADDALTALFLGLGLVALLVGGIGVANVMVIAVLERRQEIGLRRALGATRRHIGGQFLTESLIMAGLGGLLGVVLGVGISVTYAAVSGSGILIPASALVGGLAAAIGIGAVAGLYPALRAARLSPTDALRGA